MVRLGCCTVGELRGFGVRCCAVTGCGATEVSHGRRVWRLVGQALAGIWLSCDRIVARRVGLASGLVSEGRYVGVM